jgi:rhodanese-related sulfurtransferase
LIDVREPEEFTGPLGHLPAAELVPLGDLLQVAAGWPRDQPLVLICRSDRRSDRGALALEQVGFQQTASMIGGMIAWVARG